MKVALFITCLTDQFYPQVGVAVAKILEHFGCTVSFPKSQTCCGQLSITTASIPNRPGWRENSSRISSRTITSSRPAEAAVRWCASIIRIFFMKMPLIKLGCSR